MDLGVLVVSFLSHVTNVGFLFQANPHVPPKKRKEPLFCIGCRWLLRFFCCWRRIFVSATTPGPRELFSWSNGRHTVEIPHMKWKVQQPQPITTAKKTGSHLNNTRCRRTLGVDTSCETPPQKKRDEGAPKLPV